MKGWGFHLLASMKPFATPEAEEMLARLPLLAKHDLMEWETQTNIRNFLNQTLKKEIPVDTLLNDDPIYISDDRPFNEYFLLRRFRDKRSGNYRFTR
jgi:hypothetical protein